MIEIPPGQTSEAAFEAGAVGAYYYWATAGGDTLNGRPYKEDSQMSGAFIVDPVGSVTPDRVFVIGAWRNRLRPDESLDLPVVNGKSWPYTERLEYTAGSNVRWRWLNASAQTHPMHMHGSYFRVDSIGDAERDTALSEGQRKTVATQLMQVGGTMTTYWQPSELGRWLFHCRYTGARFAGYDAVSTASLCETRRDGAARCWARNGRTCHGDHGFASLGRAK